jgi:uncharacterized protein (DUF58 family)
VRIADLQGFFYRRVFVQEVQLYRVLPALSDARGRFPTLKRYNLIPLVGAHRHRRPGSGSELLDLRDYLPGDPPKMIAWKASARRDRLMTKEFESEVPIRCTLFVDTSCSVRVGLPGQNAVSRLVEIVAVVAQANAAARDLTGLCIVDEQSTSYLKPGRGRKHLTHIFEVLADVANLRPTIGQMAVAPLLQRAYSFAEEVYPHLLESDVNYCPWWLPFWAPQAAYTMRRPSLPAVTRFRMLRQFGRKLIDLFRQHVYCRLSARQRQGFRMRKRLAAMLAPRRRAGPGKLALLLENDEQFVLEMESFLNDHHVPFELPLFGPNNEYTLAAPEKVEILARALRVAVGRGRDNELYVILADLLHVTDWLDPLLAAAKMATARHHTVLVVCPLPFGSEHLPATEFQHAQDRICRAFARFGVQVTFAQPKDAAALILSRLERLRSLERGVR